MPCHTTKEQMDAINAKVNATPIEEATPNEDATPIEGLTCCDWCDEDKDAEEFDRPDYQSGYGHHYCNQCVEGFSDDDSTRKDPIYWMDSVSQGWVVKQENAKLKEELAKLTKGFEPIKLYKKIARIV